MVFGKVATGIGEVVTNAGQRAVGASGAGA